MKKKIHLKNRVDNTYNLYELMEKELNKELEKNEFDMDTVKIEKLIQLLDWEEMEKPIPDELNKDNFLKRLNSQMGEEVIKPNEKQESQQKVTKALVRNHCKEMQLGVDKQETKQQNIDNQGIDNQKAKKQEVADTKNLYYKMRMYKAAAILLTTLLGISVIWNIGTTSMADGDGIFQWIGQKFGMVYVGLKGNTNREDVNMDIEENTALSNEDVVVNEMSTIREAEELYDIDILDFQYVPEGMELDFIEVKASETGEVLIRKTYVDGDKYINYQCRYCEGMGSVQFSIDEAAEFKDTKRVDNLEVSTYVNQDVNSLLFDHEESLYMLNSNLAIEEITKIIQGME